MSAKAFSNVSWDHSSWSLSHSAEGWICRKIVISGSITPNYLRLDLCKLNHKSWDLSFSTFFFHLLLLEWTHGGESILSACSAIPSESGWWKPMETSWAGCQQQKPTLRSRLERNARDIPLHCSPESCIICSCPWHYLTDRAKVIYALFNAWQFACTQRSNSLFAFLSWFWWPSSWHEKPILNFFFWITVLNNHQGVHIFLKTPEINSPLRN